MRTLLAMRAADAVLVLVAIGTLATYLQKRQCALLRQARRDRALMVLVRVNELAIIRTQAVLNRDQMHRARQSTKHEQADKRNGQQAQLRGAKPGGTDA